MVSALKTDEKGFIELPIIDSKMDPEKLAELNKHLAEGRWCDLARAIFRPFKNRGIIIGHIQWSSLRRLIERLSYDLEVSALSDLGQFDPIKFKVILERSSRNMVYLKLRWGDYRFTHYLLTTEGKIERFNHNT